MISLNVKPVKYIEMMGNDEIINASSSGSGTLNVRRVAHHMRNISSPYKLRAAISQNP